MERLHRFFSTDFMAPHGFCFLWLPEIVWLHVISDALIALAYFSIPLAMWSFARKRPDMPFHRIFIMFVTFITLCGLTHLFDILVLWVPYYGPQGLLMLATGIVSSVTAFLVWKILPSAITLPSPSELAEMNRKLTRSYDEIEQKVSERTIELEQANAELIAARRKADEASQAKSDFLANMSHEMRTPMNVVIGLSNILTDSGDPLTERQKKFLSTLKTSADSLLFLIDDLLDIARVESSQFQIEEISFNLFKQVQETVVIMEVRAREKGLTFHLDVTDEIMKQQNYMGDPNRLRQVIFNLCSNAIKFTEKGGITISLARVSGASADTDIVTLNVADTGIGIAEEKQETIFEKFVQADNSINRKYGGTGLGLAITKTLVDCMGGSIGVHSKVGEGAIFSVTIPLKLAHASVSEHKDVTQSSATTAKIMKAPSRKKILLAEDYEPNVLVAANFLERAGFRCDVAANGIDVVEMRFAHDYALILMDVQMPGKNGLEATEEIRRREAAQNLSPIPIIGMTAHAYAADCDRCLQAGMNDYLAKPYGSTDMLEKIHALLDS